MLGLEFSQNFITGIPKITATANVAAAASRTNAAEPGSRLVGREPLGAPVAADLRTIDPLVFKPDQVARAGKQFEEALRFINALAETSPTRARLAIEAVKLAVSRGESPLLYTNKVSEGLGRNAMERLSNIPWNEIPSAIYTRIVEKAVQSGVASVSGVINGLELRWESRRKATGSIEPTSITEAIIRSLIQQNEEAAQPATDCGSGRAEKRSVREPK